MMERLGEHLDPEHARPRPRAAAARGRGAHRTAVKGPRVSGPQPHLPGRHRPEPRQDHRLAGPGGRRSSADGHRLGFLKPVGQRYLVIDGTRADEDAVLMKEVFDLPDALNDMSPVTLPRHFTTDFVMGRVTDDLATAVAARRPRRWRSDKDVVLIEGTGHAGVGAVIGLSNARRGGDAGGAGHHRQRGRRGPADRRDRAQPRPVRAARRAGAGGGGQQGQRRGQPGPARGAAAGPGAARDRADRLHPVQRAAGQSVAGADRHAPARRAAGRRGDGRRRSSARWPSAPCGPTTPCPTCATGRCSSRPATATTCWRSRWRRIRAGHGAGPAAASPGWC